MYTAHAVSSPGAGNGPRMVTPASRAPARSGLKTTVQPNRVGKFERPRLGKIRRPLTRVDEAALGVEEQRGGQGAMAQGRAGLAATVPAARSAARGRSLTGAAPHAAPAPRLRRRVQQRCRQPEASRHRGCQQQVQREDQRPQLQRLGHDRSSCESRCSSASGPNSPTSLSDRRSPPLTRIRAASSRCSSGVSTISGPPMEDEGATRAGARRGCASMWAAPSRRSMPQD